jgi:lipooligosaccharide transport system permease protein
LPQVQGRPYLHYLACGALSMSAMNSATFEALYSAFSRMHVQKTWDAIMNTPLQLGQIVMGEWIWAATKSVMSTSAMMCIVALLGVGQWSFWLAAIPVLWLGALMFSAIGLCVNAKAPGYDFFMFYFTLAITPMTFLSGAFFPRAQLPEWLATVAHVLPLSVLVDAVRAVFDGDWGLVVQRSVGLASYSVLALMLALFWTRKRFNDA